MQRKEEKVASGGYYYFLEYGIFTREDTQGNEALLEHWGKLISVDEAVKLAKIFQKKNIGSFMYYIQHQAKEMWYMVSLRSSLRSC